jgi:cytidylate kinase
VAYQAIRNGISATDEEGVAELCRRTEIRLHRVDDVLKVFVDAQDVTEKIRTEPVGLLASTLSAMPVVRSSLLTIQRESGKNGGIIAEGRDMGTVVFPDADLKFFLDADVEERARRRYLELVVRGEKVGYPSLKKDLLCRDRQDRERTVAPLKVPEGAIMVDSTRFSIDAVVKAMLAAIPEQR